LSGSLGSLKFSPKQKASFQLPSSFKPNSNKPVQLARSLESKVTVPKMSLLKSPMNKTSIKDSQLFKNPIKTQMNSTLQSSKASSERCQRITKISIRKKPSKPAPVLSLGQDLDSILTQIKNHFKHQ
jgi:hypothetical protein